MRILLLLALLFSTNTYASYDDLSIEEINARKSIEYKKKAKSAKEDMVWERRLSASLVTSSVGLGTSSLALYVAGFALDKFLPLVAFLTICGCGISSILLFFGIYYLFSSIGSESKANWYETKAEALDEMRY